MVDKDLKGHYSAIPRYGRDITHNCVCATLPYLLYKVFSVESSWKGRKKESGDGECTLAIGTIEFIFFPVGFLPGHLQTGMVNIYTTTSEKV